MTNADLLQGQRARGKSLGSIDADYKIYTFPSNKDVQR